MSWIKFEAIPVADLLKLLGAIPVFGIGLYQYAKAQKWKRREFIASQIKGFEEDRKVQLVMAMLDWNDRELCFSSETDREPRLIKVDDDLLCAALLPHQAAGGYHPDEVIIRDYIDHFLDMLVRLANFVDAGLISVKELRPYMNYWVRLIAGKMPDWHRPEVFILLRNYITIYGFEGPSSLIKDFGFESNVRQAVVDEAIKKTVAQRSKTEWHVS